MGPGRAATILHADLDAFYASVEQLLDPRLRHRPIAVGGGVVLAASYEARACGVRSGMAGWRARRLCPSLRFVGGHFSEYQRLGDRVIDVFRDFTPLVERVSIDEAFLDVAGAVHLFGPPGDIARAIRRRVRDEIGLPVSVGVARTKHLAKVASQVAKPDGLVVVEADRERAFLDPLPVGLIWGVGPATGARLAEAGITTIGQLAEAPGTFLEHLLGDAAGHKLSALAGNVDPRPIETTHRAKSVGAQAALGRETATPDLVRSTLGYLVDRAAGRLRAASRSARTVTVRVRFTGMRSVTRSVTVPAGISATLTLAELATELARGALADHPGEREITLLAVSLSNLVDEATLQLELPLGLDDDSPAGDGGRRGAMGRGQVGGHRARPVRARRGGICRDHLRRDQPGPRGLPGAGRTPLLGRGAMSLAAVIFSDSPTEEVPAWERPYDTVDQLAGARGPHREPGGEVRRRRADRRATRRPSRRPRLGPGSPVGALRRARARTPGRRAWWTGA